MIPPGDVASTVYPRWRGEHIRLATRRCSRLGLSPLARGTLLVHPSRACVLRFIPAGAGNTGRGFGCSDLFAVYPRWRGEHYQREKRLEETSGLSPLARGTPKRAVIYFYRVRFIPAGAGNTKAPPLAPPVPPVYPRWRGEHFSATLANGAFPGLSPLARGTQVVVFR